jgi:hypothetical protein
MYAVQDIRKGTRVIEYLGERITHAEADRRYQLKPDDDGHTFLFVASRRTVIDATVNGNDARYINHSCAANCETVTEGSRIFIDAVRKIRKGEELGYDYQLTWESTDDPSDLALYDCRCGAKRCRGTMLDPEPVDLQKNKQLQKQMQSAGQTPARRKNLRKKKDAQHVAKKKGHGKTASVKMPGKNAVRKRKVAGKKRT